MFTVVVAVDNIVKTINRRRDETKSEHRYETVEHRMRVEYRPTEKHGQENNKILYPLLRTHEQEQIFHLKILFIALPSSHATGNVAASVIRNVGQ